MAFALSASLFGLGAPVAIPLLPSRRLQELRDAAAADDASVALCPALAGAVATLSADAR